jgi:7-dehydrocholesterol reductase
MLYCSFLTVLLMHRAKRDEEKCLAKYGKGFKEYMKLVPWRVVPNVY